MAITMVHQLTHVMTMVIGMVMTMTMAVPMAMVMTMGETDNGDDAGNEPEGMDVTVVGQHEQCVVDASLLGRWTDLTLQLQLNCQVRQLLEEELAQEPGLHQESHTGQADAWERRAWPVLCKLVRAAVVQQQPSSSDGVEESMGKRQATAIEPAPKLDHEDSYADAFCVPKQFVDAL